MKISMKIIVTLCLLATCSSFATNPAQVNFQTIQLEGLQILDSSQTDVFGYKIKLLPCPTAELKKKLQEESYSKVVSPIYELNQASTFKNVYVYVGLTEEGTYELVVALFNSRGGVSVIDMKITDVTKSHLQLVHGPPDEQVTYLAQSSRGPLFP